MMISAFKNAKDTKPVYVSVPAVIQGIMEGRWRNLIEPLQSLSEEDYKEAKKSLPAVTFSGTFSERKADKLLDYSNIVVLDIDNIKKEDIITLKSDLAEEEYVYAAFISPSRKGIKILYKVNTGAENHNAAFLHLQKTFQDKYLYKVDDSGKDTSRLCFVSHDDTMVYHPNCKVFEVDIRYGDVKMYTQDEKFKNYQPLKDHKELFKLIKFWIEFTGTTIQYVDGSRNRYIHAFGCALNRVGLPLNEAIELLQSNYDLPPKELISTVRKSYFQNSNEHASIEVKDLKSTEYKAPPYIANYHEDVVENDLAIKTALLYHKSVSMPDIADIIGKIAHYYNTKGFIDLTKGSLKDLMNKSIQQLNNKMLEASAEHSLEYQTIREAGMRIMKQNKINGVIPTYLGSLDIDLSGGLQPQSFYGIIGLGGTFKSFLMQYICYANAANGIACLYLSGEMSLYQTYERFFAMVFNIDLRYEMIKGHITEENMPEWITKMEEYLGNNLFIVDGSGFNKENVNATIDNIKAKTGKTVRVVAIDGLSNMDSYGREEAPAAIMNSAVCKEIAKTCNGGEGAVVMALMHTSGDQNFLLRDTSTRARGGLKTVANMDAVICLSLLMDPETNSLENTDDILYLSGKFYLRLKDKRTRAGTVNKIIRLENISCKLNVEEVDTSIYEIKRSN